MIDINKIPEPTFKELVDLLGQENAERYIINCHYNYRQIQMKILSENLKKSFGKNFWIYFWILISSIAIVFFILKTLIII